MVAVVLPPCTPRTTPVPPSCPPRAPPCAPPVLGGVGGRGKSEIRSTKSETNPKSEGPKRGGVGNWAGCEKEVSGFVGFSRVLGNGENSAKRQARAGAGWREGGVARRGGGRLFTCERTRAGAGGGAEVGILPFG